MFPTFCLSVNHVMYNKLINFSISSQCWHSYCIRVLPQPRITLAPFRYSREDFVSFLTAVSVQQLISFWCWLKVFAHL